MKKKDEQRIKDLEQKIHTLETCHIPARRIIVPIPDYGRHVIAPGIEISLPKLIKLLLEELNLGLVETPARRKFEKVKERKKKQVAED